MALELEAHGLRLLQQLESECLCGSVLRMVACERDAARGHMFSLAQTSSFHAHHPSMHLLRASVRVIDILCTYWPRVCLLQ